MERAELIVLKPPPPPPNTNRACAKKTFQNCRKVALLKVDVERAELIVLKGMAPEDWKLVEQAAVEVRLCVVWALCAVCVC